MQSNTARPGTGLLTVVLALLAMFPPLATDMYLAAIGDVARSFDASHAAAELSLSLFFLGLCIGQLLIGPLLDVFGRKAPLIGGIVLFVVASSGLLLTDDVAVFNGLRFLQAVGACAGMVAGRAIVSDLYKGREAARVMTLLVMLMTLGPVLAPFLGSLLFGAFGWRSIFQVLVMIGAVALVLSYLVIPETLPREARDPDAAKNTFRQLGVLLGRRAFILPSAITGFVQASMFAFITGSSGVFQGVFGLSSTAYGILFGCIALALVVFGQVNNMLLRHFDPERIVSVGLPAFVASSALLFVVADTESMWVLVVPLWISVGLVGLLTANCMHIAMEGSAGAAGIGSAGVGAFQFGVAFATSTLVALGGTDSAVPMASAFLVASFVALCLWIVLRRFGPGVALQSGT